jgi:transposase InsO family protein
VSHARCQHPNAVLTPEGRRRMVAVVLDEGWSIEATAERFQVDAKTVRKWCRRWLEEGGDGLKDRSSRPHRSPKQTAPARCDEVLRLRRDHRWGADRIGHVMSMPASTVQAVLRRAGEARLDVGDRATRTEPIVRYQRERPGELIHVDIKKLAAIPDGGGWKIHGRGNDGHGGHSGVGYRYLHSALDDRSRYTYSEILDDELGPTAAGFWTRAAAAFAAVGIACERVITDNGPCYKSRAWHDACAATGTTVKKTQFYRPQTNGKIERFHRVLLEEWAYIQPWHSETERALAYEKFIHFYNHHRPHGALDWATPASIIGDNLPTEHT